MKYGQIVQVQVGDKLYTNDMIDIDFVYTFDDSLENNVGEISLWNVSSDTSGGLEIGTEIILSAGYKGDVGVIFKGKVGDFETVYHDVDRELLIYISDGVDLLEEDIIKSYENARASVVVKDVFDLVGIKVGKIEPADDIVYYRLVLDHTIESTIERLIEDTGSKFYIKNGLGYFVSPDYNDGERVFLDETSGLLDSPERLVIDDKIGWKIMSLLEHRITIGSVVSVASRTIRGDFRVIEGTHDSEFITEIEVLGI